MLLRLVAAVLAMAALAGSMDIAKAQDERMMMLNGGAPRANNFNFFGFGGTALQYGVGVGRIGFTWKGTHKITAKKEWPSWTPPAQMRKRVRGLPAHMEGGIDNPLGARAMYLGSTLYRIHGSNEPETIGQAVSSGCFRMTNDDVEDLYNRVAVGTTVIVR